MDRSYLEWPFFTKEHVDFARRLDAFSRDRLNDVGSDHDESDAGLGRTCREIARRALHEALGRVVERDVFGKKLSTFQLTRAKIADMGVGIDAAALLVYRAAWTRDTAERRIAREASMAKLYATETAQQVIEISCGEAFRTRYGAPYMVVHRRDLHGPLLEACRKREEIVLHTSKELMRLSDLGDRVVASCADGSEYEGAVLVGADGLRSRVREVVINDGPPRVAGHVTYRGVVPIDEVKDTTHFNDMVIWIGPNLHLVQYRLRGGTVMNNVATVVSRRFRPGATEFGTPDELFETFAQTTPSVRDMLSYVGNDKNWVLHDRDPMPGWTRGRVTLLGDAAHPTLQYLAQGACMAIEDAVVLAALLSEAGSDVNSALVAYEKARYLRAARVQITARIFGEIIHCGGGARDLRNHLLAQRTPETFWEVDWLYRGIRL